MNFKLTLKQIIMIVAALIGLLLIIIFKPSNNAPAQGKIEPTPTIQVEIPQVVSTNPSELDGTIIPPAKTVEITFNLPIENSGEFKHRLEPKVNYKVSLSDDRKTVRVSPDKLYPAGVGLTLFISPETKFDNKKRLPEEIIYHFKTVEYTGI